MDDKKAEENEKKDAIAAREAKLKETAEEIRDMAVKKRKSPTDLKEGSMDKSDESASDNKRRKARMTSNEFSLDLGYSSAELDLMKEEADLRRAMDERRLALEEQRVKNASQLRKEELEMRRMTFTAQKALSDALAALAKKIQ